MQDFIDKKIVLGICGGIAAYKSLYLVRELSRLGAKIRVVMTESATRFISPLTWQALSGEAVRVEIFDAEAERAMGHIELARWADYLLLAPATANMLAKMAHGLADDLLSTLYLVMEKPVIVCPAMNKSMWQHPATAANCQQLQQHGVIFCGPAEGSQACGEFGEGRLAEVEDIINALRLHAITDLLKGREILITAGPTREAIDPVRYISNHSSGKMGYALAAAAERAGASVTLISGPVSLKVPQGVQCHAVISASDMYEAVFRHLKPGAIFIGCAAVADYAPDSAVPHKIKKNTETVPVLNLKPNRDIIQAVAASGKAAFVAGFAAETEQVLLYARHKMIDKKLDMIIANQVGEGLGFNEDIHEATVITSQSDIALPAQQKIYLAGDIIRILSETLLHSVFQKEMV